MKLSTKTKYGLQLMLDLANNSGAKSVFLKDIAKRQKISEKYLWQVASALKNAGLINSIRGCQGGYSLTKAPQQINLREIVCALEGRIGGGDVVGQNPQLLRGAEYVARKVWQQISEKIMEMLESMTLKDLTQRQNEQANIPDYQI